MESDIVERLSQTGLTPSHESDLQVVHGLAAELRCIAHDHARDDGFVRFSGTRWLSYYHSLDRILMEHDRRQAEIYKSADEIERLRNERDEARWEVCGFHHLTGFLAGDYAISRGWNYFNDERKWSEFPPSVTDFKEFLKAHSDENLKTIERLQEENRQLRENRND